MGSRREGCKPRKIRCLLHFREGRGNRIRGLLHFPRALTIGLAQRFETRAEAVALVAKLQALQITAIVAEAEKP